MKRILLVFCVLLSLSSIAQKKLGLIVAIGEYPKNSDWRNLSSLNDVKYVKASLLQNGFSESNIDTLFNKAATKAGILKSLDNLIGRAGKGDIVVFHFSGHGQQIFDDNRDEADGYDEALIPYDAAARYDQVYYKGENHLRDDQLGAKLQLLRDAVGHEGSVVVLIDACHSGTATRGLEDKKKNEGFVARGKPEPFKKAGYTDDTKFVLGGSSANEFFGGDNVGNMIVISASSPQQVNYEMKDSYNAGVGSLSYAFANAITSLKPGSTYAVLFEKIKSQIQAKFPSQIPMIEGKTNQEIFSNNYIVPESYIAVQQWLNDSMFSINAGMLSNINRGAKVKIYALNDREETTVLAEGYIKVVGSFQSFGVVDKVLPRGEAYRVKVDESGYGDFSATLQFRAKDTKAVQPASLIKQMKSYIKPYQYLSVANNPDYIVDVQTMKTGSNAVMLIDKSDSTRWAVQLKKGDTLSKEQLAQMLDNLKRAMRVNYLRNMRDGGTLATDVTVELIPAAGKVELGADLVLKPRDVFSIKITNNSHHDLYFTLIDLLPDNDLKVLIPEEDGSPADYMVQSKAVKQIDDVEVDAETPLGTEYMKFIFTKKPMDLRPVFQRSAHRGPNSKTGIEEVFDDMFKDGNDLQSTRSNLPKVKVDEIGVVTRAFSIKR
ncbi:MAG: hypothetical protein K0Q66_384 [Chitinophagaceae bacterium]|nr:hypothetical protein [Chitinophagaceae bacterium]